MSTSLNVLKQKLYEIYPAIQIYINEFPENGVKPFFLFKIKNLKQENISRWLVTHHITWQLFYYPADAVSGAIEVYQEVDKLNDWLSETRMITYENLSYKINNFEFTLEDNQVCATISLEAQTSKLRPEYEDMAEIHNTIKEV